MITELEEAFLTQVKSMSPEQAFLSIVLGIANREAEENHFGEVTSNFKDRAREMLLPTMNLLKTYRNESGRTPTSTELSGSGDPILLLHLKAAVHVLSEVDYAWRVFDEI